MVDTSHTLPTGFGPYPGEIESWIDVTNFDSVYTTHTAAVWPQQLILVEGKAVSSHTIDLFSDHCSCGLLAGSASSPNCTKLGDTSQ